MLVEYEFEDGKYKVIRDDTTYATTLYRNGEYWEAGTKGVLGDKLFHAMLNEIDFLWDTDCLACELAVAGVKEAGYAYMSAAEVIRCQDAEIQQLREYEFMYKELCN